MEGNKYEVSGLYSINIVLSENTMKVGFLVLVFVASGYSQNALYQPGHGFLAEDLGLKVKGYDLDVVQAFPFLNTQVTGPPAGGVSGLVRWGKEVLFHTYM